MYMISSEILTTQSEKRHSKVNPISGPIVHDQTLLSNIETYFASRDEELLSNPYEQKIHNIQELDMRLIPLTETSKDMITCVRNEDAT